VSKKLGFYGLPCQRLARRGLFARLANCHKSGVAWLWGRRIIPGEAGL